MAFELRHTIDKTGNISQQRADLALNAPGLIAHLGILDHGLNGLHGEHQNVGGDDHDA